MSPKLLIDSLKTQDTNLGLLIESLDDQKGAIIKNDYTLLEDAIGKEQTILKNIEREESSRINVINALGNQYNLKLSGNLLEDLINKGNNHFTVELKEINLLRKSLKKKIETIRNKNTQLKDVIDFSRSLIKETMMAIAGPSKRAFVNKRV